MLVRPELDITQMQKPVENIPSKICDILRVLYIVFKNDIDEIRYTNKNDITEKSIICKTCLAILVCLVRNRIIEIPMELIIILKYGA